MRLCRFDDDRLGVVRGREVYDITALRDQALATVPRDAAGYCLGLDITVRGVMDVAVRAWLEKHA